MPQLDELGARDELIPFKDEGDDEDKACESVCDQRDLDEVKSSLVHESENNNTHNNHIRSSTPDSEHADGCPESLIHTDIYNKQWEHLAQVLRRQDVGLFKSPPYPGYSFLMIPDLSNCSLSPGAGRYQPVKWPLLDIPSTAQKDPRSLSPAHLSNQLPVVQHTHLHPLWPLITYSGEHLSSVTPPSHLSPHNGHPAELSPYYPLSPGPVGQITHPLGWLVPQQVQHVRSVTPVGLPSSYSALAVNASMSSLESGCFSSRLLPHLCHGHVHHLQHTGIPRPATVTPVLKQEPETQRSSPVNHLCPSYARQEQQEERKPHIKKPLNAFMLYMKEMRSKVVSECTLKESAAINQILGRRWHSLSREEQAKYYELARKERQLHTQLHPGWSARDNYGKRTKKKREAKLPEHKDGIMPPKKPSMPYLPYEVCDSLCSSHSSMLDSPATPSTSLASPALPAATHTGQAQAPSLTTKAEEHTAKPCLSASSSPTSPAQSVWQHSQASCPFLSRQIPFTSIPQHSHHALLQVQPLVLVTRNSD